MQAYQQGYAAQANKGTLLPGQSITVNKYTVVVERYLSQGGFAHVYLVRTAQPVYNTTHHVLKRIAVPNETMLSEVKKEVDIMRILKGHPNIVFLIDAAWHRIANGTYEVFILMEFCPGGGIIDMMNRRLRERLTEAEILTIFIEVCEGLAAMHALKPPILHRDLKVENILQASATSYKLCDFGSATPVQKVPANTQELRLLETDLNRHTTLQYRAPEMIDVHLRRPIDEKSDVWALGVLLYKLCYYTTPFEEHGPLAILNVQYKIPPYPVYSAQMNGLIASMLKEHGAQRPSVFEILLHVHNLRGTKSRFTYNVPAKEPLSPRSLQAPLQALSPNINANPLEDLVSYKSQQPAKNAGVEAREKVLEAIAPMRRGRPQGSVQPSAKGPSRHASPEKPVTFETKFGDDASDRVWRGGLRASRSGQPSLGHDAASLASKSDTDAWSIASRQSAQKADPSSQRGFDNDFSLGFGSKFTSTQTARSPSTSGKPVDHASSGFSAGFGDAFDPSKAASSATSPATSSRPSALPSQPSRLRQSRIGKDAFDGLALPSQPQAPTLAEARMSRTGLASFGSSSTSPSAPYNVTPPTPSGHGGLGTSNTTYRPPSIHASRPTPSPQLPQSQIQPQSNSQSSIPPPSQSWRQHVKAPTSSQEDLSAEERFPSLEDLDRTFASPSHGAPAEKPPPLPTRPSDRPPSRSGYMGALGTNTGGATSALNAPGVKGRFDGVRSQQVTGTAMREARGGNARPSTFTKTEDGPSRQAPQPLQGRPSLSRKHRSSVSMKTAALAQPEPVDLLTGPEPPFLPPRPPPQDWLTGPDEGMGGTPLGVRTTGLNAPPDEQPKLRDSPSKRASFIERSPITFAKPLEAESVIPVSAPQQAQIVSSTSMATELEREWDRALESLDKIPVGKSERERRKVDRKRSKSPATATTKPLNTRKDAKASNAGLGLQMPSGIGARQGGAPSPSPGGLTDNWSPLPSPKRRSRSRQDSGSSVSDVGPEDPSGYMPKGGTVEKMKELEKVSSKTGVSPNGTGEGQRRRRTKSKGRQSSVHELVDLWGGGLEKAKGPTTTTAPNKRSSVILPASGSTMQLPPVTMKPRSSSPQPITTPEPLIPSERPLPSPNKHTKQPSSQPGSRRLPVPPAATSPSASEPPAGRSRPQSMFISPIGASKSAEVEVPSSTAAAAAFAQQSALSPPGAPRRPPQARRSSISDMVQRYETFGGLKPPKGPGPGPPAKPAALSLKTHQSTGSAASADTFSPSAAATRFPKLSPTTSPVLAKANLAVPEDTGRAQFGRDFAKHRTSPSGLPSRTSPVGRLETPYSAYSSGSSTGAVVNGAPSRRSPLPEPPSQPQPQREQPPSRASIRQQQQQPPDVSMAPPPSPRIERRMSAQLEPPANPTVRSPSPEKPYQGVSRLIDRWQRAVDGEAPARPGRGGGAVKKAGVVGGDLGRS